MIDRIRLYWIFRNGRVYAIGEEHSTITGDRAIFLQIVASFGGFSFRAFARIGHDNRINYQPFVNRNFIDLVQMLDALRDADDDDLMNRFRSFYTLDNEHTEQEAEEIRLRYIAQVRGIIQELQNGTNAGTIRIL